MGSLGLLLALGVSAASLADAPVGWRVLDHVAYRAPTVTKAWVDGGYNQKVVDHGADLGIDVEVVCREPGAAFKVLPRRWVVERTFDWFMLHQRLVRDYETRQESSRTMIHWSIIGVMGRDRPQPGRSWQTRLQTAHPVRYARPAVGGGHPTANTRQHDVYPAA